MDENLSLIHCIICDEELTDAELEVAPFNKITHEFEDICFECIADNSEAKDV